jgi:coiled-coil domain-containing protein 55
MSFKFGLNVKNKLATGPAKPGLANKAKKKKPLLGGDDDDDNIKGKAKAVAAENVQEIGGLEFEESLPSASEPIVQAQPKPKKGQPPAPPARKAKPKEDDPTHVANSASAKESERRAQEAVELDASIYDYDAAYDALHAGDRARAAAEREAAGEMKPKYMEHLFESAEQRKKDLLRARDKLLQREREAEGDEFADKEKFVTGAYKAQQEEARQAEEEEKKRVEEEEEKKRKFGMVDFHKKMLMEKERRHQEAMDAAAQAAKAGFATAPAPEDARQKSEAEVLDDLRKQGKSVLLNEDGQVADRSHLLSAGLNIIAKPKPPPTDTSTTKQSTAQPAWQPRSGRQAQRERHTQMVVEQIEQANKRKADEEAEEQAKLMHAAKSQKTVTEISSAKERYLQRKREKEEAAAKAKAGK